MWRFLEVAAGGFEFGALQTLFNKFHLFFPGGVRGSVFKVFSTVFIGFYFVCYKLHGHFLSSVTVGEQDDLHNVIVEYLLTTRQPRSVMMKAKKDSRIYSSEREDPDSIKYEPSFGTTLYWDGWRPLWVTRSILHGSGNSRSQPQELLAIATYSTSSSALRDSVKRTFDDKRENETVYTVVRQASKDHYSPWSKRMLKPSRSLDTIIIAKSKKDEIVEDLQDFLNPDTRKWYSRNGTPYRRGHLFFGPPGTGKTSMVFALAGHLRLEIFSIPINDPAYNQETFSKLFLALPDPCIVLLEDIDALGSTTTSRTSLGNHDSLGSGLVNLSGLLNCLDGVHSKEGLLLFMTTNHPEFLDEALTRPGRIDKRVEFTYATPSELRDTFLNTFSADGFNTEEIHELADQFSSLFIGQFTVAEVQGYLFHHRDNPQCALAGAAAWSKQNNTRNFNLDAKKDAV